VLILLCTLTITQTKLAKKRIEFPIVLHSIRESTISFGLQKRSSAEYVGILKRSRCIVGSEIHRNTDERERERERERGASLLEYVLVLALVVMIGTSAINAIGNGIGSKLDETTRSLDVAAASICDPAIQDCDNRPSN